MRHGLRSFLQARRSISAHRVGAELGHGGAGSSISGHGRLALITPATPM